MKAPIPYNGGKRKAAPAVWAALGDVEHYSEPFMGSMAVLLNRPHPCNRPYHSETVNDADGLLVNAWRAIQRHPDATADAASWPCTEADMHAQHLALVRWRAENQLEHLMGDPEWCDVRMAGWWLMGMSRWIGSGYCSGDGPWVVDPSSGRMVKRTGTGKGVSRKLPHVSDDGQGVDAMLLREPGVSRQLPHVSDNGKGVDTMLLREPGVSRQLPHVSNDGKGVDHPGLRESGVFRKLPHVSSDGQGVDHAGLREEGVGEYHPMTMPKLREWFGLLSARLRHVRVLNGDWQRACTSGVLVTLSVRQGGIAGMFLDPPYAASVRQMGLYAHDSGTVAQDVTKWCVANGANPLYRVVLAGFEGEHNELEPLGWRKVEWYAKGHLQGGYANQGSEGTKQHLERLWLSPHCLNPAKSAQLDLGL